MQQPNTAAQSLRATDATDTWLYRVNDAFASAQGRKGRFFVNHATRPAELIPSTNYDGLNVEIKRLLIDGSIPPYFGEETLPLFVGEFDYGHKMECPFDELYTHDPYLIDLVDAVASGFSLARELGYLSPQHLDDEGTAAEIQYFVRQIPTIKKDEL